MPSPSDDAIISPVKKEGPNISEGKITPTVINTFDFLAKHFFREKAIVEDEKVWRGCSNITNPRLLDWYTSNADELDKLTWDVFLKRVRDRFLKKGWDTDLQAKVYSQKQGRSSFDDFISDLECINTELKTSTLRFSDAALRVVASANLCEDLRLLINNDSFTTIADYNNWKTAVSNTDSKRTRTLALMESMLARNISNCANTQGGKPKTAGTQTPPSDKSTRPPRSPIQRSPSSSNTRVASSAGASTRATSAPTALMTSRRRTATRPSPSNRRRRLKRSSTAKPTRRTGTLSRPWRTLTVTMMDPP